MIAAFIILGIIFIVLFLITFVPIGYNFYRKHFFKRKINRKLYSLVKSEDYYLLNNVVINIDEQRVLHIDHLVVGNKYIYVVADRFLGDGVEGSPEDETFFVYRKGKRIEISNPIYTNNLRSYNLARFLRWSEDKPMLTVSIVVTNNDITIGERLLENTQSSYFVREKHLVDTIKRLEYESVNGDFDQENLQKMVDYIHEISKQAEDKKLKA